MRHSSGGGLMGIEIPKLPAPRARRASVSAQTLAQGDGMGSPTRTLVRGLAILDCFSPFAPRLSLQQIARMTGLPKATAFRLVHTLQARGWLVQNDLQEYALSGKLAAAATLGTPSILELARPVMRDLAQRCGQGVTLHTLAGSRRVFLDAVASPSILRAIHYCSDPVPLCLGGATLVLLATMPPADLHELLPLAAQSVGCPPSELSSIIETTRKQGYAVSHGGGAEGITGIAAPVRTGKHGGLLCITIVLPTPAAKGRVSELVAMAQEAAGTLSRRLSAA